MPDQEFREGSEIPPTHDAPSPATTSAKKPNGEAPLEPTVDIPRRRRHAANGRRRRRRPMRPRRRPTRTITSRSTSSPAAARRARRRPEDLDEDAREFARLRRDLPNVGGSAAIGIMSIGVAKAPPRNEFFRTRKGFRPIVDLVVDQVGMDQKFHAVDPDMARRIAIDGHLIRPSYALFDPDRQRRSSRHSSPLSRRGRCSQRLRRHQGTWPCVRRKTNGCAFTPTAKTPATASIPSPDKIVSPSRYGRN